MLGIEFITQILENQLTPSVIQTRLEHHQQDDTAAFTSNVASLLSQIGSLLEMIRDISESLSLDQLLQKMVEIATHVLQADRGSIFLYDDKTHQLYARLLDPPSIPESSATPSPPPEYPDAPREIRIGCDEGIAGYVFRHGEPLLLTDPYNDHRFNPQIDQLLGYRTRDILCVPIRTRARRIIAVIQILNKKQGSFQESDLRMLEWLTTQASATLQSAQLFEHLQHARDEETRLLEMTTSISTELHLQPLLQKIMHTTSELLRADRSTLFIHDARTKELWSVVAQGSESHEIRFPAHLGIAGSVFQTGQTINIPDAYADDRFNPAVDKKTGYKTQSILCMPVQNKKGEYIGVFQVLNKRGGPFTTKDEQRLKAFAAQASIALENAQLFDEILNIKNYNENILESLSDGVLTLDAEMRIIKCNHAFERIFQMPREQLTHRPVERLFGASNAWVLAKIKRVIEAQLPESTVDADLVLPNQATISVNLQFTPLLNLRHELIGAILVVEDISSEKRLKTTMARYMTKEVVERLLESGETLLGGSIQHVSVLFSDIRRFTTIAEQMGAQETVSLLNEYFGQMVDIIFRHQGILDKYIGDALMAVFGGLFGSHEDADQAVSTGVEMLRSLAELNENRARKGLEPLEVGIGINTGEVIAGNIGSLKRMDYTVIGDGVNLAARLESANKFYRSQLLISEYTYQHLKKSYLSRPIDLIRVKGKQQPVTIFEILDAAPIAQAPYLQELLALHKEALHAYRNARFDQATSLFQSLLRLHPQDAIAPLYLERCAYFRQSPPAPSWDGVWNMIEK